VTDLGRDLQDKDCPVEARSLGRTLLRGRHQIFTWHSAHLSYGPIVAANKLIKRVPSWLHQPPELLDQGTALGEQALADQRPVKKFENRVCQVNGVNGPTR
jgi:hypothetical protein